MMAGFKHLKFPWRSPDSPKLQCRGIRTPHITGATQAKVSVVARLEEPSQIYHNRTLTSYFLFQTISPVVTSCFPESLSCGGRVYADALLAKS